MSLSFFLYSFNNTF